MPGGEFRVNNVLTGGASAAQVIAELDNIQGSNWDTTNIQYASAYVATRMLHDEIQSLGAGFEGGIKHLTEYLAADTTRTLDNYFADVLQPVKGANYADANTFIDNVVQATGVAYIGGLTLTNANDTGGIGGAEADGGARDTSWAGSVPDIANLNNNPLLGFAETFPGGSRAIQLSTTKTLSFQVGANVGEIIDIDLVGMNTGNLGISNINLVSNASQALNRFDAALDAVNTERARLGAAQNRLESAASSLEVSIEK